MSQTFLELSEPEKKAALTTGTSNRFGKATTLYTMELDVPYTVKELYLQGERFIGDLPFDVSRPMGYCAHSLAPIGMVVKSGVRKEGRWVKTFAKTNEGETYGVPAVIRFLALADKYDKSLSEILGITNARGSVRTGYVLTDILKILSDRSVHTVIDMSLDMGVIPGTITNSLNSLKSLKFVDYKSVRSDPFTIPESGYSVATLTDMKKLEDYLGDDKKLREDVDKARPYFKRYNAIRQILSLKLTDIESNLTSKTLGFDLRTASTAITILIQLGVYKYKNYGSSGKSSVQITDDGLDAYRLAFEPVLKVAKDPTSRYAVQEFRELLERLDKREIERLFREEKRRYEQSEYSRTTESRMAKENLVVSVVSRLDTPEFRPEDVKTELSRTGTQMTSASVYSVFRYLLRGGRIEEVQKTIQLHDGNLRQIKHGYYRLKQRTSN